MENGECVSEIGSAIIKSFISVWITRRSQVNGKLRQRAAPSRQTRAVARTAQCERSESLRALRSAMWVNWLVQVLHGRSCARCLQTTRLSPRTGRSLIETLLCHTRTEFALYNFKQYYSFTENESMSISTLKIFQLMKLENKLRRAKKKSEESA